MRTAQLVLGVLSAAALLAACGDDESGNDCGPGTVAMGGSCVPAEEACGEGSTFDTDLGLCVGEDGLACAEGTAEMDGECVPDGSVICDNGTSYDMSTGTCVPDLTGCAEGTVEVDGECVPFDDTLVGDNVEPAEPNSAFIEDSTPGTFTVPAAGGDAATFSGCITPSDFDGDGTEDEDLDSWFFEVSGPTLLDIKIDGKGGMSSGFSVFPADEQLAQDGWVRFSVNLVSDGTQRQVFLPKAGAYAINVADSRTLTRGSVIGNDETCYFMQVSHLEMPTPEVIENERVIGELDAIKFFVRESEQSEVLDVAMRATSNAVDEALVTLVNDGYRASTSAGEDPEASLPVTGVGEGDSVLIVADYMVNQSLTDVAFELDARPMPAQAAPEDGSTVTLTQGSQPTLLTFSASAGEVVRVEVGSGETPVNVAAVQPGFANIGPVCNECTEGEAWFQIGRTGTHYLRVTGADLEEGETYDFDVTFTTVEPTAASVGTPTAGSLEELPAAFYEIDASSAEWLRFAVENLAGTIEGSLVSLYPRGQAMALTPGNASTIESGEGFERIYAGEGENLLLEVRDADEVEGDETFDLNITAVEFTDLGTLEPGDTAARMAEMLEASATGRYLVRTVPLGILDLTVTGAEGFDAGVQVLGPRAQVVETIDETGEGEAESRTEQMTVPPMLAFQVAETGAEGGMYDVEVGVQAPPYAVEESDDAFVDICPDRGGAGVVHETVGDITMGFFGPQQSPADDDGLSVEPLDVSGVGFSFFGEEVTEVIISTNGWLTVDGSYEGNSEVGALAMPADNAVNGVIAPFWLDLDRVDICTLQEEGQVTIQWRGVPYGTGMLVRTQAVLASDGTISFRYGTTHWAAEIPRERIAVGVENRAGTLASLYFGDVMAGGAITFTPGETATEPEVPGEEPVDPEDPPAEG